MELTAQVECVVGRHRASGTQGKIPGTLSERRVRQENGGFRADPQTKGEESVLPVSQLNQNKNTATRRVGTAHAHVWPFKLMNFTREHGSFFRKRFAFNAKKYECNSMQKETPSILIKNTRIASFHSAL